MPTKIETGLYHALLRHKQVIYSLHAPHIPLSLKLIEDKRQVREEQYLL